MGRVVLGRRRVRVDVACSAGGRKEQGRDYPRSAGECRGGSGTGGQQCARMVAGSESEKNKIIEQNQKIAVAPPLVGVLLNEGATPRLYMCCQES